MFWEAWDPLLLARLQFATNISFHILFPSITIALGWVLFAFKIRYHQTLDERWMEAYGFWVKIFALSFALGVVSGITMSFQFGTNWPGFMERVGNIAGPLLAYEILTAFFLEATFLGIMLFGLKRVGHKWHTGATLLVAIGTTMSAFWILVLSSWMHTPAGFEMREGVAHATDWMAIVFSPSLPYRLTHTFLASFLAVSFLMAGVSAYRYFKGDRTAGNRTTLKFGVWMGALLMPVQIFVGDLHGLNTLEYQPAKIAAIEAVWDTKKGVPLVLFGIPDEEERVTHAKIAIPNLASFILTHEWDGEIRGLNDMAPIPCEGERCPSVMLKGHPPVAPVFYAFRIMVGTGMLMLVVGVWGIWTLRKGRQLSRPLMFTLIGMTFSGWVATLSGWYTTEIGRQPWLVHGVLTTAEAAGPVPAGSIALTLAGYLLLYGFLLLAYVGTVFYLAKKATLVNQKINSDQQELSCG